MPIALRRLGAACLLAAVIAGPAAAAPRAHTHGQATLDVAVEGDGFTAALQMPMEALVGFEHRPRTEAQRQAAQAALKQLQNPAQWLLPDAAAGCTVAAPGVELQAPRLQPAAPGPAAAAADDGEHADVEATVRFQCRTPAALKTLEVTGFSLWPRLQRLVVQTAGPRGQGRQTLTRSAPRLSLSR